jgi:hypothetical protein
MPGDYGLYVQVSQGVMTPPLARPGDGLCIMYRTCTEGDPFGAGTRHVNHFWQFSRASEKGPVPETFAARALTDLRLPQVSGVTDEPKPKGESEQ